MRYCFITGVSRGLGRSIARSADDESTRVIGFGRSKGDFEGVFHSCDFTKPQLAASIFEDALASEPLEEADSIVFINNAGTLGPIDFAQNLDAFDIEQTIAANLCGAALAAARFLKRVEALPQPKLFAQISSGAALPERARASWSLYCACKAGQEQLIRAIALEQAGAAHPCKLININPGVMETAMQETIRATSPASFPDVQRFIELKNAGKVPSPDAIAAQLRSLLSDLAALENGRTYALSAES